MLRERETTPPSDGRASEEFSVVNPDSTFNILNKVRAEVVTIIRTGGNQCCYREMSV